tara:strand:+ start:1786 stop:1920 length:135 start_codon:yes stop_codon:yes gene_type:complete
LIKCGVPASLAAASALAAASSSSSLAFYSAIFCSQDFSISAIAL